MTRTHVRLSVCLLLMCCALPLVAQRAVSADSVVPAVVKFTGTLNDVDGKPLAGTVGVMFLLYKDQTGGAPLWMETQNVQADRNGHYSVMLGSATSHGLPAEAFAIGEARWLGIQPSGQAEQPRVVLASVPYALKAADAETLGGKPASAYMITPVTGSKPDKMALPAAEQANEIVCSTATGCKAGSLPLFVSNGGPAKIGNSIVTQSGTTLKVTGNQAVTGTQAVTGNVTVSANQIVNGTLGVGGKISTSSGLTAGGTIASLGSSTNDGVIGNAVGKVFAGVYGANPVSGYGVVGVTSGTSGQGVYGESFGTQVSNGSGPDGVHGVTHSPVGSGVAGVNLATGGIGVYGAGDIGFATVNNVQQARTAGGWVKAMMFYSGISNGIAYCFNSTLSGLAATTPPCGFLAGKFGTGDYVLNFGFQVNDRFFSAGGGDGAYIVCTNTTAVLPGCGNTINGNSVEVVSKQGGSVFDTKFYLIVY
jgi:trimeric autotransporter adhesin